MTPRALADTLQRALGHHQAGQLAQAEPLYREILRAQPRHADALHLLGVLAHQVGQHAPAADLIRQAIRENPRSAGYHCNLGEALRALGHLDDAARSYETALQLQPDYLEALINLATVRKAQGRLADALAACEHALRLNPRHAGIHNNLGNILHAQDRTAEAAAAYRTAVQLRPDYADAHCNLGHALRDRRDLDAAATSYETAQRLNPAAAESCFGLGNVRQMQDRLADAAACFRRALELQPDHVDASLNLGLALQEQNLLPAALEHFRHAVAQRPDYPEAHFNLALAALTAGDFATGWREYEWRWRCKTFSTAPRDFGRPLWDGSNPAGKTILLHAEQGWGDTLQFIRYATLLAERGATVLAEVPPPLARLIATVPGLTQVIARGAPLPPFDFHAPLMSLPGLCQTTPDAIPARVPYLFPPPISPAPFARTPGQRHIGLVWAGGTAHQKDHLRSLPFAAILPLIEAPHCRFFSLQVGPRSKDLDRLSPREHEPAGAIQDEIFPNQNCTEDTVETPAAGRARLSSARRETCEPPTGALRTDAPYLSAEAGASPPRPPRGTVTDLSPHLTDFAITAGVIQQLDLVITVDTAVAHLAGALGKPVWILIPFAPDWRWQTDRPDSPWYPTARLFRQTTRGDWGSVIDSIQRELSTDPCGARPSAPPRRAGGT